MLRDNPAKRRSISGSGDARMAVERVRLGMFRDKFTSMKTSDFAANANQETSPTTAGASTVFRNG